MKVLHVIDKSFVGGGQVVVRHLLEASRAAGIDTELACRDGGPLVEQARALGVPVHLIPFDKRFRPGPARAVARIMQGDGIQIMHSHGLVATTYCTLARSWFGVHSPLIYHQHGFHHHNYGPATVELRKAAERAVSRRADRVITASRLDSEWVERWRYAKARQVLSIPYGIPDPAPTSEQVAAARASAGLSEHSCGPVIGCIARLHPQKGLDVLLRATASLTARFPKATLVIVGTGEIAEDLQRHAMKLGLGQRVRWAGAQPSTWFLPLFDLAVISSNWEGLPIILLEYMAAALPIVTTDVGGCAEAAGPDGALVVPPGDADRLAAAIERVLGDPLLGRRLGAAARSRYLEQFTLDVMLDRFATVYRELTS
jgi:glycosyltransferase involved in cell wall biosynthesis